MPVGSGDPHRHIPVCGPLDRLDHKTRRIPPNPIAESPIAIIHPG